MRTEATITCPFCGVVKTETLASEACRYFYRCEACETVLSPKSGDCCVFCSFADVPCPPKQVAA